METKKELPKPPQYMLGSKLDGTQKRILVLNPQDKIETVCVLVESSYSDQLLKALNSFGCIKDVYEIHKKKLDIMKENRAKSDEEEWSCDEINKCDSMIALLAGILSDINKIITN